MTDSISPVTPSTVARVLFGLPDGAGVRTAMGCNGLPTYLLTPWGSLRMVLVLSGSDGLTTTMEQLGIAGDIGEAMDIASAHAAQHQCEHTDDWTLCPIHDDYRTGR